jgi:hypothetical protein
MLFVLCLILVTLPPGETPLAFKIDDKNKNEEMRPESRLTLEQLTVPQLTKNYKTIMEPERYSPIALILSQMIPFHIATHSSRHILILFCSLG